ncbi:MAG: hypothetical protein AAF846_14595 [Chloroflexota bacterium]
MQKFNAQAGALPLSSKVSNVQEQEQTMIDARTGTIQLTDNDAIIANVSRNDFDVAFPDAEIDWEHNTRAALIVERFYDSGWRATLKLQFTEHKLTDVLMRVWDTNNVADKEHFHEQQSQVHAELLAEWLDGDAPYHYDWGVVQLLTDNPYSTYFISVQYN